MENELKEAKETKESEIQESITIKDVNGNDVEINLKEFNAHGYFRLTKDETALIIREFKKDNKWYMSSNLIVPKPNDPSDKAPISVIFATSISIQMENNEFIQQHVNWLADNINKLKTTDK
jgi:hypothetical protein